MRLNDEGEHVVPVDPVAQHRIATSFDSRQRVSGHRQDIAGQHFHHRCGGFTRYCGRDRRWRVNREGCGSLRDDGVVSVEAIVSEAVNADRGVNLHVAVPRAAVDLLAVQRAVPDHAAEIDGICSQRCRSCGRRTLR